MKHSQFPNTQTWSKPGDQYRIVVQDNVATVTDTVRGNLVGTYEILASDGSVKADMDRAESVVGMYRSISCYDNAYDMAEAEVIERARRRAIPDGPEPTNTLAHANSTWRYLNRLKGD